MAVVEQEHEVVPVTFEEEEYSDTDTKDHGPFAHIYDDSEYPIALCGHRSELSLEDNPDLPWYERIDDCKECWSIQHTLDDIDSL